MNISLYPQPHDKQKQVIEACSLESPNRYTIVCAGRQGGKSTTAKHQVIYWALTYAGSRIWYVMPSEAQCRGIWRDICSALNDSGLIKSKKASTGSIEIVFKNGTIVEFKSGSSSGLRGTPINFLILDEAAFLRKDVVESDILPAMNVAGRKVLICSTPKGKNWFYQFYLMGKDKNNKDYKSFTFLSTDNPAANPEAIAQAKLRAPDAIFRQEYLAEFVDGAEVFKNVYELTDITNPPSAPEPGKRYFCGIDVGLVNDETVVTIVDNFGRMVFMDRFTGIPTPGVVQRILKTLKHWRPNKTLIELNNQGRTIYDYIYKEYRNIEGFDTTNKSKEEIINRLIAAFSGKEIRCFDDDDIRLQLESFIFEMTATGKVRYKAADGFHDDIVISLALAWNLHLDGRLTGGYFVGGASDGVYVNKKNSKFKTDIYLNGLKDNYNGEDDQEYIFFK